MSELQWNRRRNQKGFTLLEFLIAVMILSIGLLGMATLTGAMINFNTVAYNSTKAVTLAEEKMEGLRNRNYQSLSGDLGTSPEDSDSDSESIFTRTWTLTADTPDDNMITIEVEVTWDWKGTAANPITLTSIVGR
jgi:type IV pilus assembly protein PilV